jgi:hypothetical protein
VSGLIDEGVTEERPVKACRYVLKALYSGGDSCGVQLHPVADGCYELTAEACSSAILRSIV